MSEKRMWAAFEDCLNGPATRRNGMNGWTFDERFKAWADSQAMTLVTPNNTLAVVTSKHMEAAFLGGLAAALPTPAGLCSVCSGPAQPSLTLNLEPVCTNCVRTGKAFNKEEA